MLIARLFLRLTESLAGGKVFEKALYRRLGPDGSFFVSAPVETQA